MGQWGEELYLTFAKAAVAYSDRVPIALTMPPAASGMAAIGVEPMLDWSSLQRERIAAAEAIAMTLSGEPLFRQRHRIAGLKRSLTLEPEGLSLAGNRAARTRAVRNSGRPEPRSK